MLQIHAEGLPAMVEEHGSGNLPVHCGHETSLERSSKLQYFDDVARVL